MEDNARLQRGHSGANVHRDMTGIFVRLVCSLHWLFGLNPSVEKLLNNST